jgi:integrase
MAKLITTNLVTSKVKKRTKVFDTKCPGFYVSILPPKGDADHGRATFSLQYWDIKLGKRGYVEIGVYDPKGWTVELARAKAQDLSGRAGLGRNIKNEVKILQAASGATVGQMIDDFIAAVRTLEKKADGEMRPILESWENVRGFLNREVRPAIGFMAPADVTNNEIAQIQQNIAKRSTSGARQTRSAMKRLFAFGSEAGDNTRKYGLTSSPVHNLPKVKKEHERTRVLDEAEIRTLWWGLDHPGLPCTKAVALGIKFELVSMLRTAEFRPARRSFIADLNGEMPVLNVPLKFVKKRRVIRQPLNSLAVEIVKQATSLHNHDVIFSPRMLDPDAVLTRSALSHALVGKKGKRPKPGIIEFLGMKHFTPHDLRRTASTLCGDIGISDAEIAKCLDHSKDRGENVVEAPSVTGRVYVHSKRLREKRIVLDALDGELRRIIGARPKVLPCARQAA